MADYSEPIWKVLLIDDCPAFRRLATGLLRSQPYRVIESSDGREGLIQARRSRPDLILLDLQLPDWDGRKTFQELSQDLLTRPIPVIIISAEDSPTCKAECLDMGAVDFIVKNCAPEELRARINAALRAKSTRDKLEQRAYMDGLTGLGNRFALEERLSADWELAKSRGTPLSFIIADIDRFKEVNDRRGHAAGDHVLCATARALHESVRAGDFLARYGGDEFVVVAHDCGLIGALTMGERFRRALGAMGERAFGCTVSVGVATSEPGDENPAAIVKRADAALYHAKANGRNSVWGYDNGRMRPAWPDPRREIALA